MMANRDGDDTGRETNKVPCPSLPAGPATANSGSTAALARSTEETRLLLNSTRGTETWWASQRRAREDVVVGKFRFNAGGQATGARIMTRPELW
jgi:hypothetical protein